MLFGQALGGLRHAHRVDVCHHNGRSSLGQRLGVKHADPLRASGDNSDLAIQPEEVESSAHGIALLSLRAGGYTARTGMRRQYHAHSVGTCTPPLQKSGNVFVGKQAVTRATTRDNGKNNDRRIKRHSALKYTANLDVSTLCGA